MTEIFWWLVFAGACYRLREFGDIWFVYARLRFMKNSLWWRNLRNLYKEKWYHKITFYIFLDSYHFFGNLARIAISIRVGFIDTYFGLACFLGWFVGEYLMYKILVDEK